MRLLDRLGDRYRAQGFYEGMASGASVLFTYGDDTGREGSTQQLVAQCKEAYATNGIVYAVILARMMLFSEATFKFRSNVDKRLYGNTNLRILEVPAPNQTTGELLSRMEQDVSLAGNAFVWKAEPDLLVRLPPDEVTIISTEVSSSLGGRYRKVIGYDWEPKPLQGVPGQTNKKRGQTFAPDELAHWSPYPDPMALFRGMSWLTPVIREIFADSGLTQYKNQYLEHAATPNLIVKYTQKLRPDTVDRVIERFRERFGGVQNAWQPIVLDQGSDATVVGSSLAQLDYKAVQGAGETRIAAAGGVPPIVVGLSEGLSSATYSNYQTAMRRFADLTMRPLWRSVCACLEKLVPGVPPEGVKLWYDTTDIAALRQSEIEMAQVGQVRGATLLSMVQAGYTRESAVEAIIADDLSKLEPETAPAVKPVLGQVNPNTDQVNPPKQPMLGSDLPPDQKKPSSSTPQTGSSKVPMPKAMVKTPQPANSSNGGRAK